MQVRHARLSRTCVSRSVLSLPSKGRDDDDNAHVDCLFSAACGTPRAALQRTVQAPQTIGYSLTDSPAGLAAWMLDHDADSYKKISRAFVEGHPVGGLTRDRIL